MFPTGSLVYWNWDFPHVVHSYLIDLIITEGCSEGVILVLSTDTC